MNCKSPSPIFWGLSVTFLTLTAMEAETSAVRAGDQDLASQVTIRRDHYGVPHILGQTEEAAAYGHGYVTAEDHILTLARLFLKARSEESAHFGDDFVQSDFLIKQLHMYEGAATGYQKSPPWMQHILDAYAAGYNRYVEKHRAELPEWVKPVTGIDVLAHGRRVVLMDFSMDLEQLRKVAQRAAASATTAWPVDHGSNMWAIGKGRSVSGKGILLGNPHLAWGGAELFCEVHLTVPGKVNVCGTTLVGSPMVTIGFNDNLGWSHTVNLHDCDDIYELTLDPANPQRYIYDGHPVPLRKETLSIKVKTKDGLKTRKRDLYWSHYGPVIKITNGKAYAFKSSNMDEYRFAEQWNLMGKTKNLDEFRKVLDMQALPMFNICYADKGGNTFYAFNGRFPQRPPGYNWAGIVPGDTSASEWNHILPESRLPHMINPPGGYVQNCNSAPWYTTLHAKLDRHNYPEELTPNWSGLRQQFSLEMLESDKELTLEKVKAFKFNTKLLLADRVKGDVVKLARGQTVDGVSLDEAAGLLEKWDNTASQEATGAALFVNFWRKYGKQATNPYAVPWDEAKPVTTPYGIGEVETARAALAAAVKEIKEKYGSLAVPWGSIYRLRRGALDVPISGYFCEYRGFKSAPIGDFGAFRVVRYEQAKDGKYVANGGDSYVLAVEFTSPPTAYSVVAYSQSDNPSSPHHTDQSALFAQGKWKRIAFTEDEIAKNLESSYQP